MFEVSEKIGNGVGTVPRNNPEFSARGEALKLSGFHESREERFEKFVHFGAPIQLSGIRAWFENDRLTVRLPKAGKALAGN